MALPLPVDQLHAIFKFNSRHELEERRQLCSATNSLIVSSPNSLQQRYHFHYLRIGSPTDHKTPKKSWLDLHGIQHCHKEELEPLAHSLVGTELGPCYFDGVLKLLLWRDETAMPVKLIFGNRLNLTFSGAFNFLHMLKHLEGGAIDTVHIDQGIWLPTSLPFTIHCRILLLGQHSPALASLTRFTSVFKPQVVKIQTSREYMQQDLDRINTYGPLPYRFAFFYQVAYPHESSNPFNRVFELLRTMGQLSPLVSEVVLQYYAFYDYLCRWPCAPFNSMEPASIQKKGDTTNFFFLFKKEKSGNLIRVEVNNSNPPLVNSVTIHLGDSNST